MVVYKIGSKGDEIKMIQALLGIAQDGIYGQQTYNSVRAYQAKNGLNITGNIDDETLYMMRIDMEDVSRQTINEAGVSKYIIYGVLGIVLAMIIKK